MHKSMAQSSSSSHPRLESLDILRGFDLFLLVGLETVMHTLSVAVDNPALDPLMWAFTHVEWQGLSPWDIVMPLFMFMSGVTIPFSLSRYIDDRRNPQFYLRLLKRVAILWLFGMMAQGNLLAFDPSHIYLYTNTLQAIAAGYLVAALVFVFFRTKMQIVIAGLLLFVYWFGMHVLGSADYTPDGNFAEIVDREVLGRFRDMASMEGSSVVFNPDYHYTWIWSTLNFAVTVMTGVFAGMLLKSSDITPVRKTVTLLIAGTVMILAALLWHQSHPVIKRLWTSSMVLATSGICFVLMAAFYYVVDCRRWRRGLLWLKVYGMNSILAYMIMSCVDFSSLSMSLFYGVEQFAPSFFPVIIAVSDAVITYLILLVLYRRGIYLKV